MKSLSAALLLALAIGGVAACNSGGKGPYGTAESPYPLKVAAPTTFDFPGSSITFFTFTPASTENYTISLTETESSLFWELITPNYPNAGSVQDCDLSEDVIDQICDTPVLVAGMAYDLRVGERTGILSSGELTVSPGATPTALTVNGGTVPASIGSNGSLHFSFASAGAAVHTVHLTNVDTRLRVSIYTAGDYPDPGPDAGQCVPTSVTATVTCAANDGNVLAAATTYYLLVEELDFSYADAGAGAFDVEVTSP